ncbi:MAG: hypothetical protein ACR2G0_08785 [Chthoniobacterales bacterium]
MRFLKQLRSVVASLGFQLPELVFALIVLIAGLVCAWPEFKGMATSSLWQDELYTIDEFSSHGAKYVLTHYNTNNHILFNLLSSVHDWKDRYNPFLARSSPFAAVTLAVVFAIGYHLWRRRPFEGSAEVFLLLANVPMLTLALEARGYGFLALAALLCSILAWHYFTHESRLALVGLPIVVFLGTWTVPTFVVFGGALMVVLLIYTRDLRWLISGGFALLAIGLAYWPVRSFLQRDITDYAGLYGREFASWNAVGDLFSTFLLFGSGASLTFLLLVLVVASLSYTRVLTPRSKASACLGFCILLTLVVCLKMQTPPKRTVAYLAVPLAFIIVTVLLDPFRRTESRQVQVWIMLLITLAAVGFTWQFHRTYHFLPIEAWRETAHRVEDRFPKGTEVVAQFRPERLNAYLPRDYPIVAKLNLQKFNAGKQIVVDSSFWKKSRFPSKTLPEGFQTDTVAQRRGGRQIIYYMPFATSSSAP